MEPTAQQTGVAQVLVGALDAVQRLVNANLALARTQLERQAQVASRVAAVGALSLLPALTGWSLCWVAVALWLSSALGLVWALLLVGGLNLGASVLLFVRGARRARGA